MAPMQLLATWCRDGLAARLDGIYDVDIKARYHARLNTELDVIKKNNVCNYFLIVADYVRWARDNAIAVGPGRGSGPCSLVAFALGITRIDPLRHKLPFERFLNSQRQVLPDFDIDFCDERYPEVVQYLQRRYGVERLAQISSDEQTPLESRLVIADRSLKDLVPLHEHADSEVLTTKLTMPEIADVGLVRFNVIGNKALTFMQRVVELVRSTGKDIDTECVLFDDLAVFSALRSSGSVVKECFKHLPGGECYESTFNLIKPESFADLCASIALSFPLLQSRAEQYTQPAENTRFMRLCSQDCQKIAEETRGYIIYQEQLMDVACDVAGFSYAKGDSFRRALKHPAHPGLAAFRRDFISGAVDRGYSHPDAEYIYQGIAKFGDAYFTKAHAVAYAMVVYQFAWLKLRFPTEYSAVKAR